jgi:hypothetical protein
MKFYADETKRCDECGKLIFRENYYVFPKTLKDAFNYAIGDGNDKTYCTRCWKKAVDKKEKVCISS